MQDPERGGPKAVCATGGDSKQADPGSHWRPKGSVQRPELHATPVHIHVQQAGATLSPPPQSQGGCQGTRGVPRLLSPRRGLQLVMRGLQKQLERRGQAWEAFPTRRKGQQCTEASKFPWRPLAAGSGHTQLPQWPTSCPKQGLKTHTHTLLSANWDPAAAHGHRDQEPTTGLWSSRHLSNPL